MDPAPDLRFRIGCPLALLLTALSVVAVHSFVYRRPLDALEWRDFVFFGGFIGLPFAALAVARARDALAWLLAIGLIAADWTFAWEASRGPTDFTRNFAFMLTPLAIAGACLAIAGMRGRIAWAREGELTDEN